MSIEMSPETSPLLPPRHVSAEGLRWEVSRVWPAKDGQTALPVELRVDPLSPLPPGAPRLRAGFWGPGGLELLPAGADPKLKALTPLTAAGAVVVSHRPAKRAVVRLESEGEERFVKVVRRGRAQDILDGIRRAEPFARGFRTPEVLDADESTVTFAALEGVSLHEGAAFDDAEWTAAWEGVLTAWEQAVREDVPHSQNHAPVHSQNHAPVHSQNHAPVHDAGAEAEVLRQWARFAAPHLTRGGSSGSAEMFFDAVEHTAHDLLALPLRPMRPAHRDLHDKQLLHFPEGPGLLDVDTACLADPALDLGNLAAHALWRRRQGVWSTTQSQVVGERVRQTAERVDVPQEILDVYERAALLRLTCVYAFRPAYSGLAAQLRSTLRSQPVPAV